MTNTTTLTSLSGDIRKKDVQAIARWILQYRKFATKAAMKHAPTLYKPVKHSTLAQYLDAGIWYLNTRCTKSGITTDLISELDAQRNQVSALQPSAGDRRRLYKRAFSKKNVTPPVAQLECVAKPTTSVFKYGIYLDADTIKLFDSQAVCEAFLAGAAYASKPLRTAIFSVEVEVVANPHEQ